MSHSTNRFFHVVLLFDSKINRFAFSVRKIEMNFNERWNIAF